MKSFVVLPVSSLWLLIIITSLSSVLSSSTLSSLVVNFASGFVAQRTNLIGVSLFRRSSSDSRRRRQLLPSRNIHSVTLHLGKNNDETDGGRSTVKRENNDEGNPALSQQKQKQPQFSTAEKDNGGSIVFYNDFEDDTTATTALFMEEDAHEIMDEPTNEKSLSTNMFSSSSSSVIEQSTITTTSSTSNPSFFTSLLQRQTQLQQSERTLLHQWTTGLAKSYAAFTINESYYYNNNNSVMSSDPNDDDNEATLPPFDWVRRVSIGTYPYVACGSAHGSIHVANVELQQLLGTARQVHCPSSLSENGEEEEDVLEEEMTNYLYGEYDGGGVLAVAMYGTNIVASSGREGGVKLLKLTSMGPSNTTPRGKDVRHSDGKLRVIGKILSSSPNILVTCLKFDIRGRLYMGGQDGCLRMMDLNHLSKDEENNIYDTQIKVLSHQQLHKPPSSPILSLDVSDELDLVATAHVNGDICVYSLHCEKGGNDARLLGVWNPFSTTESTLPRHARSVVFLSTRRRQQPDENDAQNILLNEDLSWSIVVGGGNGELWMAEIDPRAADTSFPLRDSGDSSVANAAQQLNTKLKSVVRVDSVQQIKPRHQGPVLSLASRPGGILVSAGHDGMLRVTSIQGNTPKVLYGLGGYKVWLGNICIDSEGKRLLSDGQDDVVVVHDFSQLEEEDQT